MLDVNDSPSPPLAARSLSLAGPVADALAMLAQARSYADDVGWGVWDFAVEVSELLHAGASRSDLRWLLCRGLAGHQREVAASAQARRRFTPTACGAISRNSCFVITDLGMDWVAEGSPRPWDNLKSRYELLPRSISLPITARRGTRRENVPGPFFHEDRSELYFDGRLVKQFRRSAPSQRSILAAFEEASWPIRIDDPLPPREGMYPKRRLSDAIKGLNRRHLKSAIRFVGDGTGEGIRWEAVG